MEKNNTPSERMREIEVFGVPALFTEERIAHDAVYPGMFCYELRSDDEILDSPRYLADKATVGFLGTVLTPVPIPMSNGQRGIEPGDLFLDIEKGYYTPPSLRKSTCVWTMMTGPGRSDMEKKANIYKSLSATPTYLSTISLTFES